MQNRAHEFLERDQYSIDNQTQDYGEHYRSSAAQFTKYRQQGGDYKKLDEIWTCRAEWLLQPFPRRPYHGRPDRVRGEWTRSPYKRVRESSTQTIDIDSTPDLYDPQPWNIVRRRYDQIRGFFGGVDEKYEVRQVLGYSDRSIVVKVHHWLEGAEYYREHVAKLPLPGWTSSQLRAEAKYLRQVGRAAHCIHALDPEEEGIRPQKELPYDTIDRQDSSSEEESSGSESREDEPPPSQNLTRRQRINADPGAYLLKAKLHRRRVRKERRWWRTREKALEVYEELPEEEAFDLQETWDLLRTDFILFDYKMNGDLAHLIYKLEAQNVNTPNRVLWSFWLCLIKACIALEYPPRKFHPRRHTGKDAEGDLFEDIPVVTRRWAGKRMVHFDIDPKNILIDHLDIISGGGEHALVPGLRLADFGSAKKIKPEKGNDYYLEKRELGKYGYLAPEQFGADWEYVAATEYDGFQISEQPIAGTYGSWTNIWGIALTMWVMITKMRPPLPPQNSQYSRQVEYGPNDHAHYCPVIFDDNPQYNYIDEELRTTIRDCMRHDPRERPTLAALLEQARNGVARQFPGESDDYIKGWVQNLYVERFPFSLISYYSVQLGVVRRKIFNATTAEVGSVRGGGGESEGGDGSGSENGSVSGGSGSEGGGDGGDGGDGGLGGSPPGMPPFPGPGPLEVNLPQPEPSMPPPSGGDEPSGLGTIGNRRPPFSDGVLWPRNWGARPGGGGPSGSRTRTGPLGPRTASSISKTSGRRVGAFRLRGKAAGPLGNRAGALVAGTLASSFDAITRGMRGLFLGNNRPRR
ncbi:kinase-like domain-containing protein [Annulohypoxylon bovei var. microspora]|nr:kinase-like domain-containing protein [Annulohypoxylon bovei var. microspora]